MVVHRFTYFPIPKPEDVQAVIEQYRVLFATAARDGKPYLRSCEADACLPDSRSKGFTLVARTTFHKLDDMRYYDSECQAHKALKAFALPKRNGDPLVCYFEKPEEAASAAL